MDDKACKVETDALLRCWKIHGADDVNETHPCHTTQGLYLGCVRKNVCIQSKQYYLLEISLFL